MTLVEAIQSGRPFRRKCREGHDYRWTLNDDVNCAKLKRDKPVFSVDDVLADDWLVLEPTVTITRSEFLKLARQVWEDDFDRTREHPEQFTLKLAKKLGLGD